VIAATQLQLFLDVLGVFVFAITGALTAVRRDFDIVGVLVLALMTGLGGGLLRDVAPDIPPSGISDWRLVTAALVAGLAGFFFHPHVGKLARPIAVVDAAGLAVFTASGTMTGLAIGAPPLMCVMGGMATAIGGGILRDVLADTSPAVFRGEWYAAPALLGSFIIVTASSYGALNHAVVWAAVALTFGLRVSAARWHLQAPRSSVEG